MAGPLPEVSSTELRACNGSGDGYVETLGSIIRPVTGNKQAVVYAPSDLMRNAVALVAHDNQSMRREWLGVDVVTVEQGSVDGIVGWQGVNELLQIYIYNVHTRDTAHRGLHHLRIPCIGCIVAAEDGGDAKPVGYANDGTQVARVLYAVEGEEQTFRVLKSGRGARGVLWDGKEGKHLLGVLLEAEASELVVGNLIDT